MEVSQSPGREACKIKVRSDRRVRGVLAGTAVVVVVDTANDVTTA